MNVPLAMFSTVWLEKKLSESVHGSVWRGHLGSECGVSLETFAELQFRSGQSGEPCMNFEGGLVKGSNLHFRQIILATVCKAD